MGIGTYILVSIVKILIAVFILLTAVAYTTLLERKVVAHMQNRWGPSRVGPFGIWQPLADGLKFIFKEDLTPPYVNKPLYLLAPIIALVTALTSIAVIPVGPWITLGGISTPLQITDVNIGLLVILGVTSVGVYGVALAGWSSNSKYSMLASLRASAQMMSYEIALGLSLIGVLILAGSFSLRDIVDSQSGTWLGFIPKWNLFKGQFVAFFIYVMAAYAETNRIPFDLAEAESELVAGYHTEYSSMKFAMFFMAEYANMFTVACLASVLFLGGWWARSLDRRLCNRCCRYSGLPCAYLSSCLSTSGSAARCRVSAMTSSWPSAGSFCCRWPSRILSSPRWSWR